MARPERARETPARIAVGGDGVFNTTGLVFSGVLGFSGDRGAGSRGSSGSRVAAGILSTTAAGCEVAGAVERLAKGSSSRRKFGDVRGEILDWASSWIGG